MPNDACNTSSFLNLNCKYARTAESEKQSQLNNRRWDEAERPTGLSEGTTGKITHDCVFEFVLESLTVGIFRYFNLKIGGKSRFWPVTAHVINRKDLKSPIRQKKKKKILTSLQWVPAVRPGQWKEKANRKQSQNIYFSVPWFHLVAPFFPPRIHSGCDDKEPASDSQQWRDVSDAICDSSVPMRPCRGSSDNVPPTPCCDLLSVWD